MTTREASGGQRGRMAWGALVLATGLLAACDVTAPLRALDRPPPAWTLTLSADTVALAVGDSARLTATVRTRSGQLLPDRPARFTSGDPSVVAADSTGRLRALRRGVAEVLATVEGLRQRAVVIVD
jgi:hypothetical protein